jgi:hypothetical protein
MYVCACHLGGAAATVGENDLKVISLGYDMVVGDDMSFVVVDEPAATVEIERGVLGHDKDDRRINSLVNADQRCFQV